MQASFENILARYTEDIISLVYRFEVHSSGSHREKVWTGFKNT